MYFLPLDNTLNLWLTRNNNILKEKWFSPILVVNQATGYISMMIQNLKQIRNVCVYISKYGDVALYGREWLRGNDVIIHMKCHGRNHFSF